MHGGSLLAKTIEFGPRLEAMLRLVKVLPLNVDLADFKEGKGCEVFDTNVLEARHKSFQNP